MRLSIGLEDPGDLIADLEQALEPTRSKAFVAIPLLPEDPIGASLRPTVIARGGNLELLGVQDGVATIEITGSPGAAIPLRAAIAAQLQQHDSSVTAVRFGTLPLGRTAAATPASVLAEQVNPAVAAHGGSVELVSDAEGTIAVRFHGRCVGCTLAEVTLRQGIEPLLRDQVPGVVALLDVTDHSTATDPFYTPAKR